MDEFQQIMQHIHNGENFLLSGGAGSGKTYSLVQVIKQVIAENPTKEIACMTYTNAAVREIDERVNHRNLNVTTIHEFLWDIIKYYQKDIKCALVELINDAENYKFRNPEEEPLTVDYFEKDIEYSYLSTNIAQCRISHDEVLLLSNYLFRKHKKLCDIIKDRYNYIFIDEYQDTQKEVVEIFLEHIEKSAKSCIVGFFGDSMQAIYEDGVGDITTYVGDGKVIEVVKKQNRRNPQLIIDLANELRNDSVEQEPSTDSSAPNMENGSVITGNIVFAHSTKKDDLEKFKIELGWDFSSSSNSIHSKELNLTHNLIADKAGFRTLMDIYDKDKIIDYKNRVKKYIKDNSVELDFSNKTFGEVVDLLKEGKVDIDLNQVNPTKGQRDFISNHIELFDFAKTIPYDIFSKIYLDKDQLIDDKKQDEEEEDKKESKRDELIKHLHKLQNIIHLYTCGEYNEFLKNTQKKINSISDKSQLKADIDSLINVGDKTIEEVLHEANEKGICVIGDKLNTFIHEKAYVYNRVKQVQFKEFQKLFEYLEGRTPFSTQHKTKGTEFENVLVVLDNGGWNDYNFNYLFDEQNQYQILVDGKSKTKSKLQSFPKILARSQKIFYVCCTRAMENLAVFYYNPSSDVIEQAKKWFGEKKVVNIKMIN